MDTQSGRIYGTEEFRARLDGEVADDHQEAFLEAFDSGRIVPVSDHVAETMRLGERERERRLKARKAAKQARKRARKN